MRADRLKAYAEKKSKKAGPIAKSSVLLDCKPWDDETDLKIMEQHIRKISMDGLTWGAGESNLLPLFYKASCNLKYVMVVFLKYSLANFAWS